YKDLKRIADFIPDFTLLPEYFWIRKGATDHLSAAKGFESAVEEIKRLSEKIPGLLVAGTLIEPDDTEFFNTCYIAKAGELIAKHRKVHLFGDEQKSLTAGDGFRAHKYGNLIYGIVVCADALQETSFHRMKELGVKLIFAPTFSKVNPEDTIQDKLHRDISIFQNGAKIANSVVAKCCSVGELFGRKANGRSLVCSPDEFLYRSDEESEKMVKVINLSIDF
ncbi:MAG: hypothetical protein GF315_08190, partial [candidate division Zixibacteria bacterium]|nr:hypothetical protein [candidate division Zixibacteria bacterium]